MKDTIGDEKIAIEMLDGPLELFDLPINELDALGDEKIKMFEYVKGFIIREEHVHQQRIERSIHEE